MPNIAVEVRQGLAFARRMKRQLRLLRGPQENAVMMARMRRVDGQHRLQQGIYRQSTRQRNTVTVVVPQLPGEENAHFEIVGIGMGDPLQVLRISDAAFLVFSGSRLQVGFQGVKVHRFARLSTNAFAAGLQEIQGPFLIVKVGQRNPQ